MSETYHSCGSGAGTIVIGFTLFLLGGGARFLLWTKNRQRVDAWDIAMPLWCLICAILATPVWLMCAPILIWMGIGSISKTRAMPQPSARRRRYLGVTTFAIVMFASQVSFWFVMPTTLRLGGNSADFSEDHQFRSFPRNQLRVEVIDWPASWWNPTPWSDWTSSPKRGFDRDELRDCPTQISLTSLNWYLGPHGLVRGDTLGEHLARWTHATPTHTTMEKMEREVAALDDRNVPRS